MSSVKKQVDAVKYNKEYFESLFVSPDYSKKINLGSFSHIYRDLANLYELTPKDKVVDFGCGNGELSFCLYQKYKSTILGIDYSGDAIELARNNLKKLKKIDSAAKISFLNVNNSNLPDLNNINCVYFCDVLEHMYDQEIALVFSQIKIWNRNKIKILVHTDNNVFLRFVRPILDVLSVISGASTPKAIKARNQWEEERHVNLTNPGRFKKDIEGLGFHQLKIMYPGVSMEKIERQLSGLAKLPILKSLVFIFLHLFKSLSPSFFGLYEYQAK